MNVNPDILLACKQNTSSVLVPCVSSVQKYKYMFSFQQLFSFFFCFGSHIQDVADKKKVVLVCKNTPSVAESVLGRSCVQLLKSLHHHFSPAGSPTCWFVALTFYSRAFCLVLVDRLCINKKRGSAQSADHKVNQKKQEQKKEKKKNNSYVHCGYSRSILGL